MLLLNQKKSHVSNTNVRKTEILQFSAVAFAHSSLFYFINVTAMVAMPIQYLSAVSHLFAGFLRWF